MFACTLPANNTAVSSLMSQIAPYDVRVVFNEAVPKISAKRRSDIIHWVAGELHAVLAKWTFTGVKHLIFMALC